MSFTVHLKDEGVCFPGGGSQSGFSAPLTKSAPVCRLLLVFHETRCVFALASQHLLATWAQGWTDLLLSKILYQTVQMVYYYQVLDMTQLLPSVM